MAVAVLVTAGPGVTVEREQAVCSSRQCSRSTRSHLTSPSVVVAIGDPFPPEFAHHAGTSFGGLAAVTVNAMRSPLPMGHALATMFVSLCRTT